MEEEKELIDLNSVKEIMSNPQINGFVDFNEQYSIFNTLFASGINPNIHSILHYGCGNGEFIRFCYNILTNQEVSFKEFLGIDYRDEVIKSTMEIYSDFNNVNFSSNIDLILELENDSFEWVISPHHFIYREEEQQYDKNLNIIEELYRVSKYGVLLTFLKESIDDPENLFIKEDRSKVYSDLVKKYNWVTIIDNYSENEYTLYIHKS